MKQLLPCDTETFLIMNYFYQNVWRLRTLVIKDNKIPKVFYDVYKIYGLISKADNKSIPSGWVFNKISGLHQICISGQKH